MSEIPLLEFDKEHPMCRQMEIDGRYQCVGMHCFYCGKACGAQGHMKCFNEARSRESIPSGDSPYTLDPAPLRRQGLNRDTI